MRRTVIALALVGGVLMTTTSGRAQSAVDPTSQKQLKQLFPAAGAFSPKVADPPHYKVFASPGEAQALAGLAFWTTELEPLETGFAGPIKILVGMDTNGILTGIVVAQHHEPYGRFSIETAAFAAQFKGKSVRDQFRVGVDVDAVSRATISVTSATRAIKNSARRMATRLLAPPK